MWYFPHSLVVVVLLDFLLCLVVVVNKGSPEGRADEVHTALTGAHGAVQ